MLFYYFKSKKELFNYLIDYGINYLIDEYLNRINENQSDFIGKYREVAKIKMKAYAKNPYIFNFFGTFYINKDVELSEELQERFTKLRDLGFSKLFKNIDTSLFREDIDSDNIIKLINYTIEGYEKHLINDFKGQKLSSVKLDPYWDEFDDFLELLKKIYYK
ncbi:TetR/AcrR family transcriptional regulator [Clostridium sp. D2Q-14]|nr:TetR/AcrR family transcriptional regulator [Anaeromonas gelatinilytica]